MTTAQSIFAVESSELIKTPANLPEDKSISRIHQFLIVFPTCAALLSLLIYSAQQLRRHRRHLNTGTIRLPEDGKATSDRTGAIRLEEEDTEEEKVKDVWDIRDEEMEIDGYPIEEEAFWRKVSSAYHGTTEYITKVQTPPDPIQKVRSCSVAARPGPRESLFSGLLPLAAKRTRPVAFDGPEDAADYRTDITNLRIRTAPLRAIPIAEDCRTALVYDNPPFHYSFYHLVLSTPGRHLACRGRSLLDHRIGYGQGI